MVSAYLCRKEKEKTVVSTETDERASASGVHLSFGSPNRRFHRRSLLKSFFSKYLSHVLCVRPGLSLRARTATGRFDQGRSRTERGLSARGCYLCRAVCFVAARLPRTVRRTNDWQQPAKPAARPICEVECRVGSAGRPGGRHVHAENGCNCRLTFTLARGARLSSRPSRRGLLACS